MKKNHTINSLDEIHKQTRYPDNYNVRDNKLPKALPESKQKIFRELCLKTLK